MVYIRQPLRRKGDRPRQTSRERAATDPVSQCTDVLSAIIISRPDKLPGLFPVVAPALIGRFKEREESVKMDVFATFNDLLLQAATGRQLHGPAAADHMVVDDVGSDSTASMLLQEVPRVVKAASRQLREKSVKTRVAALHCMRQLVTTQRAVWIGIMI